jgi:Flp pilus assembly protein TadB
MWPVMIVASYLTIAVAIYYLLPFMAVQFNGSLRNIKPSYVRNTNSYSSRMFTILTRKVPMIHIGKYLQNSGDNRPDAVQRFLKCILLWLFIPLIVVILTRRTLLLALLVTVIGICMVNGRIRGRVSKRQKALEKSFYKVYRFIDSQLSAGIKATDVIKGLHESTDDPLINPAFVRFSARYALTLDLDQAIAELRRSYAGKDIETLGTQLRQVLVTGTAGRSFQRTEDLLFSRYFSLLQQQTVSIRNRLLVSAIFMMVPTLLLFLMPMFYQALMSLATVFG